jgi:hypothetical protein
MGPDEEIFVLRYQKVGQSLWAGYGSCDRLTLDKGACALCAVCSVTSLTCCGGDLSRGGFSFGIHTTPWQGQHALAESSDSTEVTRFFGHVA